MPVSLAVVVRLPREFWPTYSAFANTRGGVILLGLREEAGHFSVHGLEDADRVITDLFNTVNNREKVSIYLLEDDHVRRPKMDGKELIAVEVPATKALQGGVSDCRNRSLQQMFLMIGLGERAGSGMAKIQQGWQHTGGKLALLDSVEPFDQTWLKMDFPPGRGEMTGQTLGKTGVETRVETPEEILGLLKGGPRATISEVARCLGKSESAIERALHKLKSEGRLMRSGARKNGRWVVIDGNEAQ